MVVDLRDNLIMTTTRLVSALNRADADELMSHLFATTDCERTYRLTYVLVGRQATRKPVDAAKWLMAPT